MAKNVLLILYEEEIEGLKIISFIHSVHILGLFMWLDSFINELEFNFKDE